MDDLKARLRGMDGDSMSIKTLDEAADRIEQLEAENVALREDAAAGWDKCEERRVESAALELALTQSQDIIDRWINTSSEQYQTIVETQEALTQSRAETAAAYERAAVECDRMANDVWASEAIRALATPDQTAALDKLIAEAVKPYVEALAWYGEQSRLARLIHSEGDTGRNALQADGGKRANAILAAIKGDKA